MNKELAGKIRFWYIERRVYFCIIQNTYYIERTRRLQLVVLHVEAAKSNRQGTSPDLFPARKILDYKSISFQCDRTRGLTY